MINTLEYVHKTRTIKINKDNSQKPIQPLWHLTDSMESGEKGR